MRGPPGQPRRAFAATPRAARQAHRLKMQLTLGGWHGSAGAYRHRRPIEWYRSTPTRWPGGEGARLSWRAASGTRGRSPQPTNQVFKLLDEVKDVQEREKVVLFQLGPGGREVAGVRLVRSTMDRALPHASTRQDALCVGHNGGRFPIDLLQKRHRQSTHDCGMGI